MALTPEQEARLLQIITAFDNGKRLNELPEATSTNPFALITEVLDEDGESKQSRLASFLPYAEETVAYGIEFDTTVSSPDCTRIGNLSLHASLPIHNRMRGCLLDDDGNVVEYLNPQKWSAHDLSGARGQVMIEIPTFYVKYVTAGNKRRVLISEFPVPGYMMRPKRYVSAYEAALDRVNMKLASVVNSTPDFRGGNNNASLDLLASTQLGRPATAISRTNFRNYARARKAGSAEWNPYLYTINNELFWLFAIEYATLNSQKAYNAELDANGYKQGGLGAGCTNIISARWSAFNGSYPFVPCGTTNSIGNGTGEQNFTMPFAYDANGVDKYLGEWSNLTAYVADDHVSVGPELFKCIVANTGESISNTTYWQQITRTVTKLNRYRGIELPFGHLWKWSEGVNVQIQSEADGGLSRVFVAEDPSLFNDSNYNGYEMRGLMARTESFIKEVIFGEKGDLAPSVVGAGAGSTTYFCDYSYTSIPSSGTSLRGLLLGGYALHGANAGFVFAASAYAPSLSTANIGSRLCFIPQNSNA